MTSPTREQIEATELAERLRALSMPDWMSFEGKTDLRLAARIVLDHAALPSDPPQPDQRELLAECERVISGLFPAIKQRCYWFDTCTKTLAKDWEKHATRSLVEFDAATAAATALLSKLRSGR